jgi:hypothetical protein
MPKRAKTVEELQQEIQTLLGILSQTPKGDRRRQMAETLASLTIELEARSDDAIRN